MLHEFLKQRNCTYFSLWKMAALSVTELQYTNWPKMNEVLLSVFVNIWQGKTDHSAQPTPTNTK